MKLVTKLKKSLTLFLSICLTISAFELPVSADLLGEAQPLGVNVARNSTVLIPNTNGDVKYIVDGNESTSWQANVNVPDQNDKFYDPLECKVIFSKVYTIDKVTLFWEAACASKYDIYVSETGEDDSWEKVASETDGKAGKTTYTFAPARAKYLKLDLKYRAMEQYGYRLYELEAFTVGSVDEKLTENLARKATASASNADGNNVASNAIDGNIGTIWQAPNEGTNQQKASQYITLQWDTPQTFNTVKVLWYGGYMKGYKLQTSEDGQEWKDIAFVNNGKANEHRTIQLGDVVTTKYLRLQGTEFGEWRFEIKEIEVYDESNITVEDMHINRDEMKLDLTNKQFSTEQLEVKLAPSNAADQTVIWTSSDSNVASVDENGLVTAQNIGKAVITATSQNNANIKKTCTVTVVRGIAAPEISVALTADKKGINIRWNTVTGATKYVLQRAVVDKEKVEVYSGTGTSYTDQNLEQNTYVYYLVAKSNGGEYVWDSKVVESEKIAIPIRVEGVEADNKPLDIFVGESAYLSASVTPNNATETGITWESNNTSVATVDEKGQVTAVKEGIAIITARSVDNPTAKVDFVVNCNPILMTNIVLDRANDTVQLGDKVTLAATLYPQDATYKDIVWSSSNDSVATVDRSGVVKAVGKGTAKITVSSVKQPEIKAEYEITVRVDVVKITLNKDTLTLQPGDAETLYATIYPENATNKNFHWTSSNPNVADVEASGRVVAFLEGTVTITAVTSDGKYSAACTIYVKKPATFKKPARVVIKSLKKSKKKVTLKWKKIADANGYQVYMKKGKGKYKRIKTFKNPKKIKLIKKKLKKGVQYSFKVRAYKLNGTKKVYGVYSKIKKIKL